MEKWLITYLFIVCSICLPIALFASPAITAQTTSVTKSSYTTEPKVFIKKVSQVRNDCLPQNSGSMVFHYGSLRDLFPVQSYFKAEANFFFTTSKKFLVDAINKKEVERVLKDHLLHLFPSHYFW